MLNLKILKTLIKLILAKKAISSIGLLYWTILGGSIFILLDKIKDKFYPLSPIKFALDKGNYKLIKERKIKLR